MTRQSAPEDEDDFGQRALPEPAQWLEEYGDVLYRYALSRLRRSHEAEEMVQETLLAALQARAEFAGRSHPRSWLLGIMRNKILSRLRVAARAAPQTDVDDLDTWFNASGKWRKAPARWGDPAALAEGKDFWRVVRRCLAALPARMAEAFTLRTLDDRPPADVCAELDISSANFWVLLHRARLRLVRCLDLHWFRPGDEPCSTAGT
jgi:RNA polymerase sigma-70 factor (ECF subfamily)